MRKGKKLLAGIVAAAMLFSSLPVSAAEGWTKEAEGFEAEEAKITDEFLQEGEESGGETTEEIGDTPTETGEIVHKGTSGNVTWSIDDAGYLLVGGSGDIVGDVPWWDYSDSIRSAKVTTTGMTKAYALFLECKNLQSIDLSELDTSEVTDMGFMFSGCSSLKELNLSGVTTAKVTNMENMFAECSSLEKLDLNGFDVSIVSTMNSMFQNCRNLTDLDMSGFKTKRINYMKRVFAGCEKLKKLDLSSFHTEEAYDMEGMFDGCRSLTSLNLSSFDLLCVEPEWKFDLSSCTELKEIDTIPYTSWEFKLPAVFASADGTEYTALPTGQSESIHLSFLRELEVPPTPEPTPPGGEPTEIIASGNSGEVKWSINRGGLLLIEGTGDIEKYTTVPWREYVDSVLSAKVTVTGMTKTDGMFEGCTNLKSVDLTEFDTSQVTDMIRMFAGCKALLRLDISKFNTQNVRNMERMFERCSNLSSLDICNFDTQNVQNMNGMFLGCGRLSDLKISESFKTSNVTDMSGMFFGCSSLSSPDIGNFNTSKVTDMSWMFEGCSSLRNLDVSTFDTSSVTNMRAMFSQCKNLKSLKIDGQFKTSNVTIMTGMFSDCSSLSSLDVSNFDTSKVTDMAAMFAGCSSLTELDLSSFDTKNVTNMLQMFMDCSSLTKVNLSSFETSNVKSMEVMFDRCSSLTELDLSNFDTASVYNMGGMFSHCSSLSSLDVSSFDTSKVTGMEYMFMDCSSLAELDVSGFDTSQVWFMGDLFKGCSSLKKLDVSHFDLSGVTSIVHMRDMFSGCSSLTSLDLSSFDCSGVEDSSYEGTPCSLGLDSCTGLTEIDTPKNLAFQRGLPATFVSTDGTKYTELPVNRSESIHLTRYVEPTPTPIPPSGGGGGTVTPPTTPIPTPEPTPAPDDNITDRPTEEHPDVPTTGETDVVKPDENGNVTIDGDTIKDTIEDAKNDADKNGNTDAGIGVVVPVDPDGNDKVDVTIGADALNDLVEAAAKKLEVKAEDMLSAGLNADLLKTLLAESNGADVILNIEKTNIVDAGAAGTAVGKRPVYDVKLGYSQNGAVTWFGSLGVNKIELKFPYVPEETEQHEKLYGIHIADDGTVNWLKICDYNEKKGEVSFETTHFSMYAVGYLDLKETPAKAAKKNTRSVTLRWEPTELAEGYTVWYHAEGETKNRRKVFGKETTEWIQKNMKPGTKYFYTVRPWVKTLDGYAFGGECAYVRGTTKPEPAKIKTVTAKDGKVTVALAGAAPGAERYAVCWSKTSDFKDFAVGVRTSYTTRSFEIPAKKGTYYVRVKSYRDLGNGKRIYGEWSNSKKIVIKFEKNSGFKQKQSEENGFQTESGFAAEEAAEDEELLGAAVSVKLDAAHFPDANFRKYLALFDKNNDKVLSAAECNAVREIRLPYIELGTGNVIINEVTKVKNIEGIRYFPKLQWLSLYGQPLGSVNLGYNPEITSLGLEYCHLKSVDVRSLKKLQSLSLFGNPLTSLDVTQNPELRNLIVMHTKITKLNVQKNPELEGLNCMNNELTGLDTTNNPKLRSLDCSFNRMKKENLKGSKDLENFKFYPQSPVTSVYNTASGVKMKWEKSEGVVRYKIDKKVYGTPAGTIISVANIKNANTLECIDTGAKSENGTIYQYWIEGYSSKGELLSQNKTTWLIRLNTPTLSAPAAKGSGKVALKWNKNSKATGYQIQYSTSSNFANAKTVKVTSKNTVTKTISGLTKAKKYYFRIRSYCTVKEEYPYQGTHYSGWTGAKGVTVK